MYNFKTLAQVMEKEGRIKGSKAWPDKAKRNSRLLPIISSFLWKKIHVYEIGKNSETSHKTQFSVSSISTFKWIKVFLHLEWAKGFRRNHSTENCYLGM